MKLICTFCLEPRLVIKEAGNFRKLECNHLVAFRQENVVLEEEIKEVALAVSKFSEFKNKKTGYTPYPFQDIGIQFAIDSGFKCLIADEQGLGKTVQALGVMYYAMKHCEDNFFPVLIIAKSSLKIQWMVNLLDWCGMEYIPQVIEDSKVPPVLGFNVYIASYDIFRRFSTDRKVERKSVWGDHVYHDTITESVFYTFPFKTVIMDEVQAIKGDSKRTDEVKKICQDKQVIALSGTPIKNNAAEYFTILNILRPDLFPSRKEFLNRWVRTEFINGYEKYTGLKNPEAFKEYTSKFIIRRTKAEVKEEIGLRVTGANRIFYHVDFDSDKLKAEYQKEEMAFIRDMEKGAKKSPTELIARLSVMRHLVGISKIKPTVDLAEEFLLENPSDRLVIFAHHDDVQKAIWALLAKTCDDVGYERPLHFHSGLSMQERYELVSTYINGKMPFLVGSMLAMGEGVDRLQTVCNNCILCERQWNPANEEQTEARFVRIGQKKDFVNATYPIATNTIDEYFTEIVETKRRAMRETLDGVSVEWDEGSLMTALYDAILAKGRKKIKKGF